MDDNAPQVVIVVSDKFSGLTDLNIDGVMTYSSFMVSLRSGIFIKPTIAYIGQGIDSSRIAEIETLLAALPTRLPIKLVANTLPHVAKHIVHKHQEQNVSITVPEHVKSGVYRSQLVLNDDCAEMQDHVTGVHVQGMLLIEAARQMMMASVETDVFAPEDRGTYSYVLKNLNIEYFQYLYPVSTDVICTIGDLTVNDKGLMDVNIKVEFYQSGQCVCSVSCLAQGYQKKKLHIMETRMAKNCVRSEKAMLISTYGSELTTDAAGEHTSDTHQRPAMRA